MGGKGDLQGGEGQLDITSIELLFVANVCVLGTCYHSYKGLILVWSLRHGPVLWGGWTRTAGWRLPSSNLRSTWGFGWGWTPASVVASGPLVCHL